MRHEWIVERKDLAMTKNTSSDKMAETVRINMEQEVNIPSRTIFNKDNLDILEGINSNCIDLIYLDPPFNKKKTFTAPIGSTADGASFDDIFREEDVKEEWLKEIKQSHDTIYNLLHAVNLIEGRSSYNFCYLAYMSIRLIECHRILKDTGSIYLHCDPTMSHYLKLVMDCIFGEKKFRNEIIWERMRGNKGSQFSPKSFGSSTDTILYYAPKKNMIFYPFIDLTNEEIQEKFPCVDENGERYYDDSSHIFRAPAQGPRPNLCYEWRGFTNQHPSGWRLNKERLEEEYQKGNFVILPNGKLQRRKYHKDHKGLMLSNLWADIPIASGSERTNYPTQKPLALLKRIIKTSSNKGDMVLDPFCGCATTCVAAELLERNWIGVDISLMAYELVKQRLEKEVPSDLYRGKPTFQTSPPKRTDIGVTYKKKKFVYVISNPAFPDKYKVGIASDMKSRLGTYQTGDPERKYKIEFKYETDLYNEIEDFIHDKYNNQLEWVTGDMNSIIEDIKTFKPTDLHDLETKK